MANDWDESGAKLAAGSNVIRDTYAGAFRRLAEVERAVAVEREVEEMRQLSAQTRGNSQGRRFTREVLRDRCAGASVPGKK